MILPIVAYGHPVLKKVAAEIPPDYPGLREFIADMWDTMYVSDGVGLAAPQVNRPVRVIVIDASPFADKHPEAIGFKKAFINPVLYKEEGEEVSFNEGCLSFPGIFVPVLRPTRIRLRYQNEQGEPVEREAVDFLARVFSHEIDHLNGRLLIDHVSPLRRQFIQRKLKKAASEADLS